MGDPNLDVSLDVQAVIRAFQSHFGRPWRSHTRGGGCWRESHENASGESGDNEDTQLQRWRR